MELRLMLEMLNDRLAVVWEGRRGYLRFLGFTIGSWTEMSERPGETPEELEVSLWMGEFKASPDDRERLWQIPGHLMTVFILYLLTFNLFHPKGEYLIINVEEENLETAIVSEEEFNALKKKE